MNMTVDRMESIENEARENGVYAQYKELIDSGSSPTIAIMLAMRAFPGLKGTDTQFNKLHRQEMGDHYIEEDRERIVKIARKAGISTAGKTYNGQLGKYDDPLAWVSGTSDVRHAAKEKGLSLRGQVNVENEPVPVKRVKMSDRLIKETEQQYFKQNPAIKERVTKNPKKRKELREQIVEKHGSKFKG